MLPGFRFLLAAIVLSISILIFGLGGAALLRAAHKEFASIPSRRAPPETMFAQWSDTGPVLAMLRADAPAVDEKAMDPPTTDHLQDQADINLTPTEVEKPATDEVAALDTATQPENSPPSEAPASETAAPEIPLQAETAQAEDTPSPAAEAIVAATAELAPPAPDPSATAKSDQTSAPIDDSAGIADSRIAALGGLPVTIEMQTPSKKMAPAVVRKSAQPKRVTKRRKIAPRARLARPAPQQPANPFGGWKNLAVQGTAAGREGK
jgi:hypothetical protein